MIYALKYWPGLYRILIFALALAAAFLAGLEIGRFHYSIENFSTALEQRMGWE